MHIYNKLICYFPFIFSEKQLLCGYEQRIPIISVLHVIFFIHRYRYIYI